MSAYVVSKATIDAIVSVWRALKVEAGEIARSTSNITRPRAEKRCPLVLNRYRSGPDSPERVPYSWGWGMNSASEGEQFAYLWEDDFKRACEARRAG